MQKTYNFAYDLKITSRGLLLQRTPKQALIETSKSVVYGTCWTVNTVVMSFKTFYL